MKIEQAVAILEAERGLQGGGCGGPDFGDGSPWLLYVQEAGLIVQSDPLFRGEFDDIVLLQECPCGHGRSGGCDGTGDRDGLCKCRD